MFVIGTTVELDAVGLGKRAETQRLTMVRAETSDEWQLVTVGMGHRYSLVTGLGAGH